MVKLKTNTFILKNGHKFWAIYNYEYAMIGRLPSIKVKKWWGIFNTYILIAAKTSLTTLMKSFRL